MALRARLVWQTEQSERRDGDRRPMRMHVLANARDDAANALLHDLSHTGMRIETEFDLAEGDEFTVELTAHDVVSARVVWKEGTVAGCQFVEPIDEQLVMETLLRSPFVDNAQSELAGGANVEEIPIGVDVDLNQFAEWHRSFQAETGRKGSQLLGFRRGPDGTIIAIVTKNN